MAASSSSEPLRTDEYRVEEVCPEGRYVRYDKIIARSGTRTVYMGFDRFDGKEIAWCKTTELSDEFNRIASMSILDTCQDDNILKFYHSWTPDDSPETRNTITELFTSGNLREYISKHTLGRRSTAIKKWCRQILRALHYLHKQHDISIIHGIPVIHRDVKIENIFVNGNAGRVKLGYFCFALQLKDGRRYSGYDGIPETLSKEIIEDEDYDEKVDIFSFGLTLLQIVCKEVLYSEYKNNKKLIFERIQNSHLPNVLYRGEEYSKYRRRKSKIRMFIDRCLLPKSERPSAIELLNDPYLADGDVAETSTAGTSTSAASIQTLRETVRGQVARLQGRMSDETVSETSRQRNVSPNRPPSSEAEIKVPEKSTAALPSTEQEEEEKEDDTPLIRRRRTSSNVKRGDETFGSQGGTSETDKQDQTFRSQGGSSETVSPSKTQETSTDEQDQTRYVD